MALCGYSSFIDGARGTSTESSANFECVTIRQCTKDILGHLAFCKVNIDVGVDCESKLQLARAGKV